MDIAHIFYALHTVYFSDASTGAERVAYPGQFFTGLKPDAVARLIELGAIRPATSAEAANAGRDLLPAPAKTTAPAPKTRARKGKASKPAAPAAETPVESADETVTDAQDDLL